MYDFVMLLGMYVRPGGAPALYNRENLDKDIDEGFKDVKDETGSIPLFSLMTLKVCRLLLQRTVTRNRRKRYLKII